MWPGCWCMYIGIVVALVTQASEPGGCMVCFLTVLYGIILCSGGGKDRQEVAPAAVHGALAIAQACGFC
jgi:hypothetical protein